MTRILFVDDERRILDALRDLLRRQRRTWDMTFVDCGERALEIVRSEHVDIVVCDMRMPGQDGVHVLQRVKDVSPGSMRMVLSGYTDTESAMRVVPVAHQVLMKPCDAGAIQRTLTRAAELQSVIATPRIRELVGDAQALPSAPTVYRELLALIRMGTASASQLSQVIERDPAMTAKLMQVVNSAFFGLPRRIGRVQEAITYLGTRTVRSLVLAVEAFDCVRGVDSVFVEERRRHAALVAQHAKALAPRDLRDDAFIAGMLHDVGALLFAATIGDEYIAIRKRAAGSGVPIEQVEQEVLGVTHAQVGGYLLGMWGLALPIVEAVTFHHHPRPADGVEPELVTLLREAEVLAHAGASPVHARRALAAAR